MDQLVGQRMSQRTGQNVGEWFAGTAAVGSLALAIPVALIAGLVSFFSPCVIPLLPGYLSYATGLTGTELADTEPRRSRMLAGSVLFVLGFTAVFVAWGTLFGAAGDLLYFWQREITLALGVLTILLGLTFLGAFGWLQRDWRIHQAPKVGLASAPLLGVLFGVGWTPCVGPTLAVIQSLSFLEASAGRGAVLSGFYALGLGLPFILAGWAYHRSLRAFAVIRRHQNWITRFGGVMMLTIGVLLVSGLWDYAVQWVQLQLVDSFTVVV